MHIKFLIPTTILLFIFACSDSDDAPFKTVEEREISRVISAVGNTAYITENFSHLGHRTHVVIESGDNSCNAASVYDVNLGLSILWVSDTTLEITHKPNIVLNLNESAQYFKCDKNQPFNVVLKELITP